MKVKEQTHNVKQEGLEEEIQFSVSESSFIYDLLSTKLYKNPYLAVVREFSVNATDANIENHKSSTPIELHLPSTAIPYLVFKDSGVGIGPDRIRDVFCKLGESTKRTTNTQTGAFGVGKNVFLAISDQMTVETIFKNRKYVYIVFRATNGVPSISSDNYDGEPTTDPSGTKITIPIKSKDINQVREEGVKLFRFFKVQPLCNVTLPTYTNLIDNSSYTLETAPYYGVSFAVMGSIVYPIDKNIMRAEHLSNYNVYLHFKIGELSVETSRDGLVYDDKTKKVITENWKAFRGEVKTEIEKQFEGLKDWELHCKKNKISKSFRDLISCESQINLTRECGNIEYLGFNGNRLRQLESYVIKPTEQIKFFIKDKPDRFLAPLKKYADSNNIIPYFIEDEQSKINEVISLTGLTQKDFLRTSMFKAEPTKRNSSTVQSVMALHFHSMEQHAFKPIKGIVKYYVIRKGTKIFHNYPHSPSMMIGKLGIKPKYNGEPVLYKGEQVYAVLEKEVKRLPKDAINLVSHFISENSAKIGVPELEKIEKYGSINLSLFSGLQDWRIPKLNKLYNDLESNKEEARQLSLIKNSMSGLGVKFTEVAPTDEDNLEASKVLEQCKLIKYLKVPSDPADKKYLEELIKKELEGIDI